MPEEHNENIDSQNDEEVTEENFQKEFTEETHSTNEDDSSDDSHEDSVDESEEVEKLKEQNKKLFERAKKAEGYVKDENGNWVKKESKSTSNSKPEPKAQKIEITPMDTIALMDAKVTNSDDINEVLDYARFKNISVSEALKSNVVKTTLADLAEKRATANATSTKGGKKGISKPDGQTILAQVGEGKFPDDPADLAKARLEQRKSKK